ncbi:hypothetical protein MLD38_002135 [Melastoma candidum]|uniref:Uncharacterized protein n=1 Tax=Melastoma candidum TaxID=119954 RepID=A0ACB9SIT3_9MYRT|nr:hypothetical protein MLD38_002135 [Melastoma candidum]
MGGVCSGGVVKARGSPAGMETGFPGKIEVNWVVPRSKYEAETDRTYRDHGKGDLRYDSGKLGKPTSKVTPKNSFIGRASIVGLDKAVDVLDTIGSGVSNLNTGSRFLPGGTSRGSRISILAFEVANTITKGSNLMQSLLPENVRFLKKEILHSRGVRQLVSGDVIELLLFAAADKRDELEVFSREVVRFGNLCKDPHWHNLDRSFSRLCFEDSDHQPQRAEAEASMQELTTLARHTSELYHELQTLDRFEQDYRQKGEELDSLSLPRKGEGLTLLHNEVKHQRKLVRSLKRKSLWSKTLEEIMEKLVDSVAYIHNAISEAFGDGGMTLPGQDVKKGDVVPQRLGTAGLALHYANVINQIDTIASRPMSLPQDTRDSLYRGLPPPVKKALHRKLQAIDEKEEITAAQIKAEMEKTLEWLVPVATNTIKAHQGFGWVGEWANKGSTDYFGEKNTPAPTSNLIRLQTLYHADKQKVDDHILELVTQLHCLVSLIRNRGQQPYKQQPQFRSPNPRKPADLKLESCPSRSLSQEDRNLLNLARLRRTVPGISKSQDFSIDRRRRKKNSQPWAVSKSADTSPSRDLSPEKNSGKRTPIDRID